MIDPNLDRFVASMWDQLALTDAELAPLACAPFDADSASRMLRTFRDIEKDCQPLGLPGVEAIAHRAAIVAERMRDGSLASDVDIRSLFRDAIAEIKESVGWIEATGTEPDAAPAEIIARLEQCVDEVVPLIATAQCAPRSSVLIVDRSMYFRNLVAVALESRNHTVTTVETAHAAVRLFQDGRSFQAVICELEFPELSGCDFSHWLRNRPGARQAPLIALTASNSAADKSRALNAGFDCFLTKFQARQLYKAMEDVLSATIATDERLCA